MRAIAPGVGDTLWFTTDRREVAFHAGGEIRTLRTFDVDVWDVVAGSHGRLLVGTNNGGVAIRESGFRWCDDSRHR